MFIIFQKIFNNIKKRVSTSNIIKILIFAFIVVLVSSTLFYLLERQIDSGLTIFDSFWWGFVTVTTVGYGDIAPVSLGGKIVATFLMVIGIGTFGLITASVATVFFDKMLKGESGKLKVNIKDHIIIFGWNNKAKSIIEEIKNENIKREILIVSNIEGLKKPLEDVHYINGDETSDETLEKANVKFAKEVIVLSDESIDNTQMIDAKSVLICLAVDKIKTEIHILAEVADENNINHFKRANVDDYIVTSKIASNIIARSTIHKHVSHSMKELTTNSYGNVIYEKKLEKIEKSITFSELSNEYLLNNKCIIIGIVKNDNTLLNPSPDEIINQGDSIIYIGNHSI